MANIPVDVAGNLAQRLVDRAIMEAKYLCCFKRYVEDFEKEKERLSATRKSVGEDIEEARQRNENRIDHETQQWLIEADSLIQEDTQAKKKWFFGLCTNCIWQYGQGKELFQKTQEIPKLIERRNKIVRVARPNGPPGMNFYSSPDFIHFESRKKKFEELKEALKNSSNNLVGLQGMGGTGKTTMATQVGKEVEESKLFDKVIFTVVSNPPNLEKIRSDIARHLGLSLIEGKKSEEHVESLWSRIANGGEKILIILDNVWEKELDLKVIGIPVGRHDKGLCSVFLTTRDLNVCKAMGCHETIQIEVLPDEEALNLFLFHAVKCGVDSSIDFKDVALDIVKGCGGLPVAIEAIAKALNSEPLQVWKATSTALKTFDPILYDDDGDMKKAYNCLKLSYDNLKNEKAQKLFLLCSLFPEDFQIPVELLSRIAIGWGLCGEVDEYNKARSQVLEVKRKLVYSSLLLENEEENVKMHDLVHEVAIKIANREIQVVRDSDIKKPPKENIRFSSWIGGFPYRFDGSKLEILIIFIKSFEIFPDALFKGMTKLRVLVINNDYWIVRISLWVKSIRSLVNIRTLRLENLKLEDISSMRTLQSLETLELVRCSIVELPNEITKLENLRLLGLTECVIERRNPFKVIERCSRLEQWYYINNSDIIKRKLEDKEVRDIGIPRTLQMYEIIGEVNFRERVDKDASLLKRFEPGYFQKIFSKAAIKFFAAKAEILELDGDYETGWTNLIPDIASIEDGGMNDLIKLYLKSFREMECLIQTKNIGTEVNIFSKLVELTLSTMGVKELCCGPFPSGFLKKLEKLHLYECSNLEGTLFKGKLDLGKLRCIKLKKCSMSSLFHPSTVQSLKQLEELKIRECHELKYIITDEGLGADKVEDDHGSLFSELRLVDVLLCNKLEFILPIRFVEDLPLLEKVKILYCEKLKHIFGQHQDNDGGVSCRKGKEIKLPSLQEMRICDVPNFINIFPAKCCHRPMSPMMKKSSITKDALKVNDPSLSCTFSWALICCFTPKSTATSIDNPIVSEAALPNRTGLQELKTQVFNPAECFLRPPLDPRNLREITITECSNFTWLFTLSFAASMPLLETLDVGMCNGLKHIFTNDRDDDDHKKYGSIFSKLKEVRVWNCDLLESLFPASLSITLDHLEVLTISKTPKLRYVLGKCDCDDNLPHQSQPTQESRHDVPNMDTAKCLLRQPLNPLHLRELEIIRCSNLTSLFTLSIASSMPLLERLEVFWCDGLKHIVTNEGDNGHDHINYSSIFPNLKTISIYHCSFLECIFPASHCRSFNQLESVEISGAHKLRYVFGKCYCEDTSSHHNQNVEIHLPALKYLQLDDVPKMVSVGTQNCRFTALSLKTVQCPPSLVGVFQGIDFQNVPSLVVKDCPNIPPTSSTKMVNDNDENSEESHQEIFEYNENSAKLSPSQDTTKCLLRQPSLHLREMVISYCSNLTSLFTLSIASSMSLLERLNVTYCHGLKHIVTNEGDNGHDHINYSSIFPYLKTISVWQCSFLEYIFPASHCRSLNHLESVNINDAHKLRYVFGKCYCEDNLSHHNQNVEIHLPALKYLHLDDVPNMVSIGTQNCHFTALSLETVECTTSIVGVFQGIDFQKVPRLVVRDSPDIPPNSSTKMGDVDDDKQSHQEIVENNENPASETNSQLQEEAQAALSKKKLSPSQSKKEVVENELMVIQMKNNNTPNLTKVPTLNFPIKCHSKEERAAILVQSYYRGYLARRALRALKGLVRERSRAYAFHYQSTKGTRNDIAAMETPSSSSDMSTEIPQQTPSLIKDREEPSIREVLKLQKEIIANEVMDSEPLFIPLRNESPQDKLLNKEAKNETIIMERAEPVETRPDMHSNDSKNNTEESIGEGPSSENYIKPTSSTHSEPKILHKCQLSSTKESMGDGDTLGESLSTNEAAGGVDKPLDNTQEVDDPTNEKSSEERSNENALAIPPTFVEMKDLAFNSVVTELEDTSLLDEIIVNQTEIDNPKQFEEDDLIRLFQLMEDGADMEVHNHMPHVSKIAAVEDDNKVGKAFADLEVSLKMGLNEIASSEENSLRLQNALNLLSTHFSEDGPPSHGLSATIDSLHQEFQSILSSFKQASSTVHAFTELDEKEKCIINEELPRRKQEARTLVSEIFKTEKSMVEAQQKEAELKELISRLQAELNSKEKETKDCEIKLLSLKEQKKNSVSETMRFMKDFEDVKKDKSQMMEEELKARQELEKVDVKWSSCVANVRKTTLLLGIHLNHNL